MTRDQAYFCGFWLGDGSASAKLVSGRRYVSLAMNVNDRELAKVTGAFGKAGIVLKWRDCSTWHEAYVPAKIRDWMESEGFIFPCTAFTKAIPESLLKAVEEVKWGLVEGLFDSDGWVTKRGDLCFATRSEELTKGFLNVLGSLGLALSSYKSVRSGKVLFDIYMRRSSKGKLKENLSLVHHKMVRL